MKRPTGFSLLELILAIGLSTALVAMLGTAIGHHLFRLEDSRSTVEQAQVARAVLDRIATDLRSVTMASTQDISERMAAAESAAQFNVDEVDEQAEDADADGSALVPPTPGVYGAANAITLDIRNVAQSLVTPAETANEAVVTPTARIDAGWSRVTYAMSTLADQTGLARGVTPYDAALYRDVRGEAGPPIPPFATEVMDIRFDYFDGTQSTTTWDMEELGAAPLAVTVTLVLKPADPTDNPDIPLDRRRPRTYQRVVRLASAADEEPTETASTGSTEEEL